MGADQQVYYDLVFKFTSGNQVAVDVLEGRDAIQDINPCTHCGAAAKTKVTVMDGNTERTLTIHADKLDAAECTKRVVDKELSSTEVAQRKWQE